MIALAILSEPHHYNLLLLPVLTLILRSWVSRGLRRSLFSINPELLPANHGLNPPVLGGLLDHLINVGGHMTNIWMTNWVLCYHMSESFGCRNWHCASHSVNRSSSGPAMAGDNPDRWLSSPNTSGWQSADALVTLALAYAVSAALTAVIAMPAWMGAVRRKIRGGTLFDWEEEKDEKDKPDEKAGQLAPADTIWEGGKQEENGIGAGQVSGHNGGDEDDGDKSSEVLPTPDHHHNTCTDTDATSDHRGAANDARLLALALAYAAVVAYVLAQDVRRTPLVWRVRWTVAIMTLSPIVWELLRIRQAALELKLRGNGRKVVIAAAMGAAACVRLLLLLWLFGTALLGNPVALS